MPVSGKRAVAAQGLKRPRIQTTKVVGFEACVSVPGSGTVRAVVKDYNNDPYFVKKAEPAKAIIEKIGLPQEK